MTPVYVDPLVTLYLGDSLKVMPTFPNESVDAVVTDPPAAISFMSKSWDHNRGGRTEWVAWMTEVMRECYRVVKPGGFVVVWSLPRTCHWTGWAIEDAGFRITDQLAHVFASGFPKGKTQLKPAREDWWLARKPGPLRPLGIDACRIGAEERPVMVPTTARQSQSMENPTTGATNSGQVTTQGRWPSNVLLSSPELFDEPNPEVVGSGATTNGATSNSSPPREDGFTSETGYNGTCVRCGAPAAASSSLSGIPATPGSSAPPSASDLPSSMSGQDAPDAVSLFDSSGTAIAPRSAPTPPGGTTGSTGSRTHRATRSTDATTSATEPSTTPDPSPGTTFPPRTDVSSVGPSDQSIDTMTTTTDRWMCGSCVAAVTSETTPPLENRSDDEQPLDGLPESYPRYLIIPKADRAERERGLEGAPKRHRGVTNLNNVMPGEYDEFVHEAPIGIGAWLKSQREVAGLQQKQVAAHFPSKTGGLTGCVANWELEFNRPTPDQWRKLREVIGFDGRYDEAMTTTTPVERKLFTDNAPPLRANSHPT